MKKPDHVNYDVPEFLKKGLVVYYLLLGSTILIFSIIFLNWGDVLLETDYCWHK